jgi:hypothetical protein
MMRSFAPWLAVLVVSSAACSLPIPPVPDTCYKHCWDHTQDVPDVNGQNMMGPPDDHFDIPCTKDGTPGADYYPPRPVLGWYRGVVCPPQATHDIIQAVVNSIQDPTVDASVACDSEDLVVYVDFMEQLAISARDACVADLTCDEQPSGCDIDPFEPDDQACSVVSAEDLCNQVILGPALEALSDLTNGEGAAQPHLSDTLEAVPYESCEFEPGTGDGGDEAVCMGGDEGVDESGTGMGVGPFGDIDDLLSCSPQRSCVVQEELLVNIENNVLVFHDESIRADAVELAGLGKGVQLFGLDRGEHSEALFDAFGLRNGDVITHIGDETVDVTTSLERELLELRTTGSSSVTVRRWTGSLWSTLDYAIIHAR